MKPCVQKKKILRVKVLVTFGEWGSSTGV
jgi:hypothetical protein